MLVSWVAMRHQGKRRWLVVPRPTAHYCCLVAKSYLTLGNPKDCSLPDTSVHGIFQQEYRSGLPFPSPGDLSDPGIEPAFPACVYIRTPCTRATENFFYLFFLGSKITADGDCSHEIKRHLLLERKGKTNLDSILKSRGITLSTKVCLVKAMVFPVAIYGCES